MLSRLQRSVPSSGFGLVFIREDELDEDVDKFEHSLVPLYALGIFGNGVLIRHASTGSMLHRCFSVQPLTSSSKAAQLAFEGMPAFVSIGTNASSAVRISNTVDDRFHANAFSRENLERLLLLCAQPDAFSRLEIDELEPDDQAPSESSLATRAREHPSSALVYELKPTDDSLRKLPTMPESQAMAELASIREAAVGLQVDSMMLDSAKDADGRRAIAVRRNRLVERAAQLASSIGVDWEAPPIHPGRESSGGNAVLASAEQLRTDIRMLASLRRKVEDRYMLLVTRPEEFSSSSASGSADHPDTLGGIAHHGPHDRSSEATGGDSLARRGDREIDASANALDPEQLAALQRLARRRRRYPMRVPEWAAHATGSSGPRAVTCGTPSIREAPTPARSVLAPSASPFLPKFSPGRSARDFGRPLTPSSGHRSRPSLGRGRSRLSAIHAPALLYLCEALQFHDLRDRCVHAVAARHAFLSQNPRAKQELRFLGPSALQDVFAQMASAFRVATSGRSSAAPEMQMPSQMPSVRYRDRHKRPGSQGADDEQIDGADELRRDVGAWNHQTLQALDGDLDADLVSPHPVSRKLSLRGVRFATSCATNSGEEVPNEASEAHGAGASQGLEPQWHYRIARSMVTSSPSSIKSDGIPQLPSGASSRESKSPDDEHVPLGKAGHPAPNPPPGSADGYSPHDSRVRPKRTNNDQSGRGLQGRVSSSPGFAADLTRGGVESEHLPQYGSAESSTQGAYQEGAYSHTADSDEPERLGTGCLTIVDSQSNGGQPAVQTAPTPPPGMRPDGPELEDSRQRMAVNRMMDSSATTGAAFAALQRAQALGMVPFEARWTRGSGASDAAPPQQQRDTFYRDTVDDHSDRMDQRSALTAQDGDIVDPMQAGNPGTPEGRAKIVERLLSTRTSSRPPAHAASASPVVKYQRTQSIAVSGHSASGRGEGDSPTPVQDDESHLAGESLVSGGVQMGLQRATARYEQPRELASSHQGSWTSQYEDEVLSASGKSGHHDFPLAFDATMEDVGIVNEAESVVLAESRLDDDTATEQMLREYEARWLAEAAAAREQHNCDAGSPVNVGADVPAAEHHRIASDHQESADNGGSDASERSCGNKCDEDEIEDDVATGRADPHGILWEEKRDGKVDPDDDGVDSDQLPDEGPHQAFGRTLPRREHPKLRQEPRSKEPVEIPHAKAFISQLDPTEARRRAQRRAAERARTEKVAKSQRKRESVSLVQVRKKLQEESREEAARLRAAKARAATRLAKTEVAAMAKIPHEIGREVLHKETKGSHRAPARHHGSKVKLRDPIRSQREHNASSASAGRARPRPLPPVGDILLRGASGGGVSVNTPSQTSLPIPAPRPDRGSQRSIRHAGGEHDHLRQERVMYLGLDSSAQLDDYVPRTAGNEKSRSGTATASGQEEIRGPGRSASQDINDSEPPSESETGVMDQSQLVDMARRRASDRARRRRQQLEYEQEQARQEEQEKKNEQWRRRDRRIRAFLLRQVEDQHEGRASANIDDSFAGGPNEAGDVTRQDRSSQAPHKVGHAGRGSKVHRPSRDAPVAAAHGDMKQWNGAGMGVSEGLSVPVKASSSSLQLPSRKTAAPVGSLSWQQVMDATAGISSFPDPSNTRSLLSQQARPADPKQCTTAAGTTKPTSAPAEPSWKRRVQDQTIVEGSRETTRDGDFDESSNAPGKGSPGTEYNQVPRWGSPPETKTQHHGGSVETATRGFGPGEQFIALSSQLDDRLPSNRLLEGEITMVADSPEKDVDVYTGDQVAGTVMTRAAGTQPEQRGTRPRTLVSHALDESACPSEASPLPRRRGNMRRGMRGKQQIERRESNVSCVPQGSSSDYQPDRTSKERPVPSPAAKQFLDDSAADVALFAQAEQRILSAMQDGRNGQGVGRRGGFDGSAGRTHRDEEVARGRRDEEGARGHRAIRPGARGSSGGAIEAAQADLVDVDVDMDVDESLLDGLESGRGPRWVIGEQPGVASAGRTGHHIRAVGDGNSSTDRMVERSLMAVGLLDESLAGVGDQQYR